MSSWQFTIGDKTVRLDDVAIDEVEGALVGTGINWYEFEMRPLASAKALVAFITYLATDLGIDAPLPLTPARLTDIVKLVPDDVPVMYEDGMPVPPKGEPPTD